MVDTAGSVKSRRGWSFYLKWFGLSSRRRGVKAKEGKPLPPC